MFIMQPCYDLTGNWWVTILIFTLITKVILLPMSLWCQKNSIVMVQLMPALNRLKIKYYGDRETIGEKQSELYKEWHYHPLLSLVPLAIQIIILFGLVDVIHFITDGGAAGTEFLGMFPLVDGGTSWIMPLLAGLSAVLMGFAQNRINPLQREQSRAEKNLTNGLSIGLSFVLGVFVAAGMCFYWICSNLSSIGIQALCNIIIKPRKYIDYEDLAASRAELEELESLDANQEKVPWYKSDPLKKREKADYKRFFNVVDKHIVFYSEGSGFYKYFQGVMEWLLANSDATIHYITNDPKDQIFRIAGERGDQRIRPYYIGIKRCITLFMKMDADVVVTTLEDFDVYYMKRSYVREDIDYVFMFHHMTSTHLTPAIDAYAHYDTLLCVGPHQVAETRKCEELYGFPAKRLIAAGYDLLDRTIANYQALVERRAAEGIVQDKPTVIIAPSWQEDNILDLCIDPMLESLLAQDWKVIVRPHPEYVKRYKPRWLALVGRYEHIPEDKLYFEHDFSSNESVYTSDILITDWSSTAQEFSFSTLKPSIFIDTPMKILNHEYKKWGEELAPTDLTLRNRIGVSVAPEDVGGIDQVISQMLSSQEEWADTIQTERSAMISHLGHGAETAGEYLLEAMLRQQEARKKREGE